MPRAAVLAWTALALASGAHANLLRNGSFQDDWATRLPENKNHHWCYSTEYQNRRDYNPDGWSLNGSWTWENADAAPGQRRLVLHGPRAIVTQRVNWVLVHDDRKLEGFPDAGGFPVAVPQRSQRPLALVRDLRLRARVRGEAVPEGAGTLELAFEPVARLSTADPIGGTVEPTLSVRTALPAGTYEARWVEATLSAAAWLEAARREAGESTPSPKNPSPAADPSRAGVALPGAVRVGLRYEGARTGRVFVERVELLEKGAAPANLLPNGSFEGVGADGSPTGWSEPRKYAYFPPRHYYIFNTWHNSGAENRGLVAADSLLARSGARSLKMVVPAGDETSVDSPLVLLQQREPRLLEVSAWVKTDQLNMLQVDVVDEAGARLDVFDFIHKAPHSIGSDEWRLLRQVARPRRAVRAVRVRLAARGLNGYTLDDTGVQPQNNAVGTVFWDDVRLSEPESTGEELRERGVSELPVGEPAASRPRLAELDLGERLLGENTLSATVTNPGPADAFALAFELRSPVGAVVRRRSAALRVPSGGTGRLDLTYPLAATPLAAYSEYGASLVLEDGAGAVLARSVLRLSPWTAPIDLELGALYLQPDKPQLVRVNLGFTASAMASLRTLRLELVRRGSGQLLKTVDLPADAAAVRAQRRRIPAGLREDLSNLLLADLDVSELPLQPFPDPERRFFVRARALGRDGAELARAESAPFCRLGHEPAQPPIESVRVVRPNRLLVNGRPFMPWGAVYGHAPVYPGPADPGPRSYRDLSSLPAWSPYDRWSAAGHDRARADFNVVRYVAGRVTPLAEMEKRWSQDNLYASSAFALPKPAFSLADASRDAGGGDALEAYLKACRRSPMVVSVAAGIEEAFGLFQRATRAQLASLRDVVERLRTAAARPVVVGHGGYWNRFEFEKVPFFDVYDPETEPLYPANLHTDLMPLVLGQAKAVWLRPQMYEDVPYERWRFHAYVELMRGARGWQFAHGPGDASLFRGLHGELAHLKAAAFSLETPPAVRTTPAIESWSGRAEGRVFVVAATTHGIPIGRHLTLGERGPGGRARLTESAGGAPSDTDGELLAGGTGWRAALHGIEYLPDARSWPGGSRLSQWLFINPSRSPRSLAILVKANGRWTHAAAWGAFDVSALRRERLAWFLRALYRHAPGFLGWDDDLVPSAAEYAPASAARQGSLPEAGRWVRLEVALDDLGAANALLDGVAFLHEEGRVAWGRTSLHAPDGTEAVVWGDAYSHDPAQLAKTRVDVAGLAPGTQVRVLFEDREIRADEGCFVDDFRGQDLYQRYGGGPGPGYGVAPVALHAYEIPGDRVRP